MKPSAAVAVAASAALASAAGTPSNVAARANQVRAASVPTVTVQGNAFFAGSERFYIRGVDYQPGGSSEALDPIANIATCRRDVAKFRELGINTVRVYTVDNTANHDACMALLAEAGIYLALDVNSPLYSLNREDPAGSYNDVYLQSVFATIDAFAGYDNTLLFFSGNEVINADNNTNCAPYVKATTRDMKQYIRLQGHRQIPVGYSAADVESNRYEMAQYMNCGTEDQRSDFFAFNDYSWCDPSSFQKSGWDQKVEQFSSYSIPLFLSEFGCITNTRTFAGIESLYGPEMTSVYSGGLVYEYSEEGSGYGLVNIQGNSVSEKPDFAALQSQLASVQSSGDGGYKPNGSPSQCPRTSSTWEVTEFTGEELPAIPDGAVQYLQRGAGSGPGLDGDGSQWATDGASDSVAQPGSGGTGGSGDTSSSSSDESAAASFRLHGGLFGFGLLYGGVALVAALLV